MNNKERISLAKRVLYAELLKIDTEDATDNEVNLMYLLAKDIQVQEALDEALRLLRKL